MGRGGWKRQAGEYRRATATPSRQDTRSRVLRRSHGEKQDCGETSGALEKRKEKERGGKMGNGGGEGTRKLNYPRSAPSTPPPPPLRLTHEWHQALSHTLTAHRGRDKRGQWTTTGKVLRTGSGGSRRRHPGLPRAKRTNWGRKRRGRLWARNGLLPEALCACATPLSEGGERGGEKSCDQHLRRDASGRPR